MKKNLIALAVLAVSGIASAQSSVTMYGKVDAFLGSKKAASLTQTVINSGGVGGSRFGIKGSEDLGDGLKANFVLESGFSTDTGASRTAGSIFDRAAWVGFSGGFGEVRVGNVVTAYDAVTGLANSAFDSSFSPAKDVWATNVEYTDRPGNNIHYLSPNMSGFTAGVSYSLAENKSATEKAGNFTAFNVKYANGPLVVSLANQSNKATGNAKTVSFTQLLGTYDLGVAKLIAGFGAKKDNGTEIKVSDAQFGVDYPVSSALTISGGFAMSSNKLAGRNDIKKSGFGIAAKYDLSKRTFVYTGFKSSKTKDVDNSTNSLFGVGVQHNF